MLEGKTILICDDSMPNREIVLELLREAGTEDVGAKNGQETLAAKDPRKLCKSKLPGVQYQVRLIRVCLQGKTGRCILKSRRIYIQR